MFDLYSPFLMVTYFVVCLYLNNTGLFYNAKKYTLKAEEIDSEQGTKQAL